MIQSPDSHAPLVRGVYDLHGEGPQDPELNDNGNPYRIRQVAHEAGYLACIGQCLEIDLDAIAGTARNPNAVLKGSSLRIDTRPDSITARTDLSGQWPLFYAKQGDRVYYSSDAEDLANTIGGQLDPVGLAYYIIGGEFLEPGRTAYAQVSRLPAGHVLHMARSGLSVDEYAKLEPGPSVRLKDTAEELSIHIRDAVTHWPDSDADTHYYALSGGYDSTSLALLKAGMLPHDATLHAFHSQRIASLSGDTAHAQLAARLDPKIHLEHIVIPDNIVPYNNLASATNTHYPFSQDDGATRETLDFEFSRLAELGATVQVIGGGGDALFTAPPQYLADLMKHPIRHAERVFKEGTLLAHEGEVTFTALVRAMRHQADLTNSESFRLMAAEIRTGENDGQLTWRNVAADAVPLLSAPMRRQLADLLDAQSDNAGWDPNLGIADYIDLNEARLSGRFTANFRRFAQLYGLDIRAPYLDDQVMAARFRLQSHLLADTKQFKRLLRETLKRYVPPEIYVRNSKGSYSNEVYQGIRKNAGMLRALFGKACLLAELGVIDPVVFQRLITEAEVGRPIPLSALERAVSAELWLREHYGGARLPTQAHAPPPSQPNLAPRPPVPVNESLPESIFVPSNILMADTAVGVMAYNLKTGMAHNMEAKTALVLRALQRRGLAEDAAAALRAQYPTIDAAQLSQDLTEIITNMLKYGTIEAGPFVPFVIQPAQERTNDAAGEVRMVRGPIDKSGVRLSDYIRMGRAMFRASKLVKDRDQFEVIQILDQERHGLPASDAESVRRHLVAGHVLARYSLFKSIICDDLTIAAILADAKRGRAVQYILAMVPDPNYYHAAPGVNGVPVQTPQDRIMESNFTILRVI